MDYKKLIELAKSKAEDASNVVKKSTSKQSSGPDPKAIENFLINKRLNEIRREEEKRAQMEKLLYLRGQNSKSNKKAKLMASRTKDNDYSKIKLTERDIENKERIDAELRKKGIDDKLGRMKQRIELEENDEDGLNRVKRKKVVKDHHHNHQKEELDYNYNYNYDKIKSRNEIHKIKTSNEQQTKPKSNCKPPTFEELMKLAEQQKNKKKTLEEEIEEELLSKKSKDDKEVLKEKEELYMKSLNGKRKGKNNHSIDQQPIKSIKQDSYENQSSSYQSSSTAYLSSQSTSNSQFKKPINTKIYQSKEDLKRPFIKSSRPEPNLKANLKPTDKMKDLPPISQVIKRDSQRPNLEKVLEEPKSSNLASKIANLSKEELLELSKAVKKVKKEKKRNYDEEYSPRACYNYDEYKPSKSTYKSSSTSEPVYVPTKIKSKNHLNEEYDPVNNYKSNSKFENRSSNKFDDYKPSKIDKSQSNKKISQSSSKSSDIIGSLTEEEIEKIRRERMAKQRENASSSRLAGDRIKQPIKLNKSKPIDRSEIRGTIRNLPPIGATYTRGMYNDRSDFSSNYYDDYEDEEEDDDMDDFIDDGEDEYSSRPDLVSEEIKRLFPTRGKNVQYRRDFSDDDDIEETSYADLMKEEAYSKKIGLAEDALELEKEKEEKRRKAKLKKKGIIISDEDSDDY